MTDQKQRGQRQAVPVCLARALHRWTWGKSNRVQNPAGHSLSLIPSQEGSPVMACLKSGSS